MNEGGRQRAGSRREASGWETGGRTEEEEENPPTRTVMGGRKRRRTEAGRREGRRDGMILKREPTH